MTLQEQLNQMHEKFLTDAPGPAAALDADTDALVKRGVGTGGPQVGDAGPDFELPDQLGQMVRSKDLLAKGPLVVTFYRGNW